MAAFEYVALNSQGKEQKGVLEGDSNRQVRQLLRDRNFLPLSVTLEESGSGNVKFLSTEWFATSLRVTDRAVITRQLATLIGAGLPVEEALLTVSKQSEVSRVQKMLVAVRSRVMEGYSLANSLANYPRAFPRIYRATVAAGESAGHLDLVLNRLADFTEAQHQTRSKIQQALVYPVILFLLTLLILAGLLGYVVPDIVEVFADTGQQLPYLTRFIISLSDFLGHYVLVIMVGIIFLLIVFHRLLEMPSIRLAYDRRLLHVPIVSKLSRGINAAQFSSTLAILSSSGVPIVEALRISGEVLSNSWLKQKIAEATVNVSEGSSLNIALDQSGYFPPMMLHMIASGEASGELDEMLQKVSVYMQQDVEGLLSILLSLFGPLMLILMGGAVFTIVMAILLPIINLNQLVI